MKQLQIIYFLVFLFSCFFACPSKLEAQTHAFFEFQTMTPDVYDEMLFDGGLNYKFSEQWTMRSFFLVKGKWAEAHLGPIWNRLIGFN